MSFGHQHTFRRQPDSMTAIFQGIGMSARPGYYSGYPARSSEFKTSRLVAMHNAIKAGAQSGVFPETAPEAFLQMILSVETIQTTPVMNLCYELERNGWEWPEFEVPTPSNFTVDKTGEDGGYTTQDLMGGMGGLMMAFGGGDRETPEERAKITFNQKVEFLGQRGVNRLDLIEKINPKSKGGRNYFEEWGDCDNPHAPSYGDPHAWDPEFD